jgi:hypothetical protein
MDIKIGTLYDQKLQLEMYEREILEIGDWIALSYLGKVLT